MENQESVAVELQLNLQHVLLHGTREAHIHHTWRLCPTRGRGNRPSELHIKLIPFFLLSAEFQEAFNLFDNRGDGKIQLSQVGECLRALGQNPTESDVKKCTHQLKPDERISFEVFLPIYQAISKARSGDTADDFIEGLRHFDKDASGYISSAELRHLLTTLGEKLTDEEVEQLLANMEDQQGNINYEEFVRMVMNG